MTEDDTSSNSNAIAVHNPSTELVVNGLILSDSVLDKLIPTGYVVAPVPEGYETTAQIPTLYNLPEQKSQAHDFNDALPEYSGIAMRKEDVKHFSALLNVDPESLVDLADRLNFNAQALVFKIKNGQPSTRKKAMRSITTGAASYGPSTLFGIILPVILEPGLDDADRHILTKLVGRLLAPLNDAIRPYTHKIFTAISPSLIDEDITLRLEAREVISNVARTAGFANVVSSLRPDLDHEDEYVRNLTSRVLAVVAITFGLIKVLPFIKAVIRSKKSWQARHTGIRTVHHICILSGGGNGALIVPHLLQLIDVLTPGISDDLLQVRTATANTLAQLAENVHPYGIEAFEKILEPTWNGLKLHRGRGLAAFLRAIGSMIPLMAHNTHYVEYSNYYTRELVHVMTREFSSPDEDMKKSILRILMSMPLTKTLFPNYRRQIVAPFLQSFWNRRVALDSLQLARLVVDATFLLAKKLDVSIFLEKLTPFAKDANENLRRMACDALNKILTGCPESIVELDQTFDSNLVDALLFALQELTQPNPVYLQAFGTMCQVLGRRLLPHVTVILSSVLYRLKSSEPEIRQQSADLITVIADAIKLCSNGDDTTMRKLILFLYELLGEVYPEVLGSIIGALHSCISTMDRESLLTLENPSVNVLLPTLTPILKNRQEKVQEQCIKLVGLIAKGNAESVNAKEWMRVCFDLLDMLKSQKKRIRIAANATFGDIARTIGPQDVLVMLLNNLNVQERQLRVCTAVAIGIVADTCSPFTILPALMNEYRVPDKNVQNGVLKALSFLFEYLDGSTTKDYLFAITPLLEDALTDRDLVHRQTASTVVRHLALNCYGLCHDDCQEVFIHFLNLVLPNIYETSPHVILRIIECLDALRIVLGPGVFLNYIWAGLFQAARKVRSPYWKVYNSAYVQNCDSIVPYYPRFDRLTPADPVSYNVEELDIWM
ncbi:splicing factor 3B subunit 1 [Metschnikowia bicuspidata var. bicuspidata NRRL YB-4993]|uniref:Splicing factor 3B subunit 1 n=1 Tax=Metschnikowia bicuspidata var. bicuspidata NRRL YB-4993 TaxID=869754 RepID=A0A1A0H5S8_9ASCO|nr:splicing factor 3B subunit 1 [Metschnikowia bicuspidata var. bicuspidata NRRL YB-4993]OBA19310.1 splicing factor 3B subunit 1 [Metschnikowia bicuspidata var. bicuspidata NRRL YB-4993]